MRIRKRPKTIGDISVSKLLDDFVDLDVEDDNKRASEMNDDEYIDMMLKKEAKRKLEKSKKDSLQTERDEMSREADELETNPPNDDIDTFLGKDTEPEIIESLVESEVSEDEEIIKKIVKAHDVKDIPAITGMMRVAVDFLQDEIGASESKRKARKTLEKFRKDRPATKKKQVIPVVSEKLSRMKPCQNCYFCVRERKIAGSSWCHCTNPGRSIDVVCKGSWVKSGLNLPCWKPTQD